MKHANQEEQLFAQKQKNSILNSNNFEIENWITHKRFR